MKWVLASLGSVLQRYHPYDQEQRGLPELRSHILVSACRIHAPYLILQICTEEWCIFARGFFCFERTSSLRLRLLRYTEAVVAW